MSHIFSKTAEMLPGPTARSPRSMSRGPAAITCIPPEKCGAYVDSTTGLALYTSGQFPQSVFEIFRQLPIVVGYLPLSLTCYSLQF